MDIVLEVVIVQESGGALFGEMRGCLNGTTRLPYCITLGLRKHYIFLCFYFYLYRLANHINAEESLKCLASLHFMLKRNSSLTSATRCISMRGMLEMLISLEYITDVTPLLERLHYIKILHMNDSLSEIFCSE